MCPTIWPRRKLATPAALEPTGAVPDRIGVTALDCNGMTGKFGTPLSKAGEKATFAWRLDLAESGMAGPELPPAVSGRKELQLWSIYARQQVTIREILRRRNVQYAPYVIKTAVGHDKIHSSHGPIYNRSHYEQKGGAALQALADWAESV